MPWFGVRSPWATTLPWTSIGISAMQNTMGWNYFERSKGGLISIVWQLVIWIPHNFQYFLRRICWFECSVICFRLNSDLVEKIKWPSSVNGHLVNLILKISYLNCPYLLRLNHFINLFLKMALIRRYWRILHFQRNIPNHYPMNDDEVCISSLCSIILAVKMLPRKVFNQLHRG